MLIIQPPMIYETTSHVCDYHKKHPENRNWPGCTCSGSFTAKTKPMEDWTDEERVAFFQPTFDDIFGKH